MRLNSQISPNFHLGRRNRWSVQDTVEDSRTATCVHPAVIHIPDTSLSRIKKYNKHRSYDAGANESIGHNSTHWSIDAGRGDAHIVRFKNGDDVTASIPGRNKPYDQRIGLRGKCLFKVDTCVRDFGLLNKSHTPRANV